MEKILVLNLGSTSFKYEVFNIDSLKSLQDGNFEIRTDELHDVQSEVDRIFREVLREIGDVNSIKYIGHRYVHGDDEYFEPTKIDEEEILKLEKLNYLAPLHNPYNLAGVKSTLKYLPEVENYAVFDTAFFKDLPDDAKVYPIPYEYFENGIHKLGFHGISHKFVAEEACKKLKLDFSKAKLITIHLGGGCSVSAIDNGKPVETSMGFTPMDGLMMQTRSGDVDPGIVFEMIKKNDGDVERVKNILNKESGIKGISGCTDYLDLLNKVEQGDEKAKLAFEMFVHIVKKYIGAYMLILDEIDVIVFTGGIGAGSIKTRNEIVKKSKLLKNIKSIVIEPNEELAIAREVLNKLKEE